MSAVLRFDAARRTNAQLMVDCRTLGYLSDDMTILDVTYGVQPAFWKRWTPYLFVTSDRSPDADVHMWWDFTRLPLPDNWCDVVVFDPPYKLNGTSKHPSDRRYGVGGDYWPVARKMALIFDGCREAARVAAKRVLVKVKNQVNAGSMVWQTDDVTELMRDLGWWKKDELEVWGYIPQPDGTSQQHARATTSTLLVFEPA